MRLIDADKVKKYILTEGFCCDTAADREYVAEELFDQLFPTVEAIPVEWIKKQAFEHPHLSRNLFYQMIIEEWEKRK